MLLFFRPEFNCLFVLVVVAIMIYKIVRIIVEKNNQEINYTTPIDTFFSCFVNGLIIIGYGAFIYFCLVLFFNGMAKYPPKNYNNSYTIQNTIELTTVHNENSKDYYLFEDNQNHEYIFGATNIATGNVIEYKVDFDHSIVIPTKDCNNPKMITVHNNHNFTQNFEGSLFLSPQFYEGNLTDEDNTYAELYVFIIPLNSVYEYTNTINKPVVA